MTKKKKPEVHGIVHATVTFPIRVPEQTAHVIVHDVEQMLFQSVEVINSHYKRKLGLTYDVLEVGHAPLEELMTPEQMQDVTFH